MHESLLLSHPSRVKYLQSTNLLDSLPDKSFDELTSLVSRICEVPIAIISLLDIEKQFFLSKQGVEFNETAVEHAFCLHAIKNPSEVFVVKNAKEDKRFQNNPLVTESPNIVFYAGVPLTTKEGYVLGALCAIDKVERTLSSFQTDMLKSTAKQVIELIELKRTKAILEKEKREFRLETKRLQDIFEATQVGTWEWNVQSGEVRVNERYAEILGYTLEEMTPLNSEDWYKHTHPDDVAYSDQRVQDCFNEKADFYDIEYRMYHKDGSIIWINDRGRVISRTEDGKPLVMAGTHTDVTDKIKYKEALKKNNERFELIMQTSSECVCDLDPESGNLYLSDGFKKIFGHEVKSLEENRAFINSLIHEDDKVDAVEGLRKAIFEEGVTSWSMNYRMRKVDNSYAYINDKAIIIRNNEGKPERVLGVLKDITSEHFYQQLEFIEKQVMETSMHEHIQLQEVLELYVKKLEELFPGMRATVLGIEDSKMTHIAAPSFPKEFKKGVNGTKIGPNVGSCGAAAFTKKRVIVSNIHKDDRWKGYADLGEKFGFVTCWSQPIFNSNGEVVATFANYYKNERIPNDQELHAINRSAQLISIIMTKFSYIESIKKNNERYDYLNKATNDAIYDWDINKDRLKFGEGFSRIFGHSIDSEKYYQVDYWVNLIHPSDKDKVTNDLENFLLKKDKLRWDFKYRLKKANGEYAHIDEVGYLIRDKKGEPKRMIGALRDVSESEREKVKKDLQYNVSKCFKSELSLSDILEEVLTVLTSFGECNAGEFWLCSDNSNLIKQISFAAKSEGGNGFFKDAKHITQFTKGEGLPGTVWKKQAVELWDNIDKRRTFIRRKEASMAGLKSAVGIPLYHNHKFIGVITLLSSDNLNSYRNDVPHYSSLGNYLGAEIMRKKQEEEMNLLFESSPDIIALLAPTGKFKKVNPAFCELLGYTEEELTSKTFDFFIREEEKEESVEALKQALSKGEGIDNFVNRYKTKHGSYRSILWSVSKVFGEDGLMFSYGRDITKVEELQMLLDEASKLSRVGAWEANLETGENYWSPMVKEIYEVDEDFQPDSESWLEFYPEEYRSFALLRSEEGLKKKESWEYEIPIITAKGNRRWVKGIGYPEFENGKCIRLYGSVQDIHEKKVAEERIAESLRALSESNERFEKIAEATNDAIWDFNIEENSLFWGKGFYNLFGYDLMQIKPSKEYWLNCIHPEDRERIKNQMDKLINDSEAENWFTEYRFRKENGNYALVIDRGIYIRNKEGTAIRAVGAITDITYRKEHEDSLKKLNEELESHARELAISNSDLEQFAYVASHDLQEPLRMVSSFLTRLSERYGDRLDDKAHKYIYFATDGARRMRRIILDLLEYSRVGKENEELEKINLANIVEDSLKILSKSIEEKQAQIKFDNLPIVQSYNIPLQQIFRNLIGNAIKYSRDGIIPKVRIKASERKDDWLIVVEDNGIGIEQEYFEKVFLIFQRLHVREKYEGSGMGLAIVKKNIDKLGESIWLESEINKGSKFYFTIKKRKGDGSDLIS